MDNPGQISSYCDHKVFSDLYKGEVATTKDYSLLVDSNKLTLAWTECYLPVLSFFQFVEVTLLNLAVIFVIGLPPQEVYVCEETAGGEDFINW